MQTCPRNKICVIICLIFIAIQTISCGSGEKKTESSKPISSKNEIIETRLCNREDINIRKGPGIEYEKDESGQLIRGEKVYVLEEKGDWIKFRVTPKDVGWSGWVRKDLTETYSDVQASEENKQIQKMMELGLLKRIEPSMNEAFVDSYLWNALDYQAKENIGRILAFYCGKTKGTNLNWVDIKDVNSGHKLAKYSDNWGFKVY